MNYTINVSDIERAFAELGGQARAKSIQDHILATQCAGIVPQNYQSERSFRQTIQRKIEDYCPEADGFDWAKKQPKFRRVGWGLYDLIDSEGVDVPVIEEVVDSTRYVEGATKTVAVNSYERSAAARRKCIAHYGINCVVCGFDFEKQYGLLGKSFIHVHHVVPLASIAVTYVVNPITDLRPVCPNCHAMLHRTDPAMLPEVLKKMLIDARNCTDNVPSNSEALRDMETVL